MKHRLCFLFSAIVLFFCKTTAFSEQAMTSDELFKSFEALHQSTLNRLVEAENKADGLSEEFRQLLGDRKKSYSATFKETGKILNEPMLLYFIVTERKRLEKDVELIELLRNNPLLLNQYRKKLASQMMAMDQSALIITFIEYLDEFNRGVRKLSNQKAPPDWETMKVLSGTLTAFHYSQKFKSTLSIANPQIKQLDTEGAKNVIAFFESVLGKMEEESILPSAPELNNKQRNQFDLERLTKTKRLVNGLVEMASTIVATNKALLDEYQYRILLLRQKLTEKRLISSEPVK